MFVELLSQFARSPEWYGMHRSGLNWVLSPVKFGNPPPVLGINVGGASHIDVLACLTLAVIYFLAFTVSVRLIKKSLRSIIAACTLCAMGLAVAVSTWFLNFWDFYVKLGTLIAVIVFLLTGIIWRYISQRKRQFSAKPTNDSKAV